MSQALQTPYNRLEETERQAVTVLLPRRDAASSDTSQPQGRDRGVPLLPATRRGTL